MALARGGDREDPKSEITLAGGQAKGYQAQRGVRCGVVSRPPGR